MNNTDLKQILTSGTKRDNGQFLRGKERSLANRIGFPAVYACNLRNFEKQCGVQLDITQPKGVELQQLTPLPVTKA